MISIVQKTKWIGFESVLMLFAMMSWTFFNNENGVASNDQSLACEPLSGRWELLFLDVNFGSQLEFFCFVCTYLFFYLFLSSSTKQRRHFPK